MKRYGTDPAYRLLQIFLGRSPEHVQVYEVYIRMSEDTLHCTCKGYQLRRWCKHSTWVAGQLEIHGGYIAAIMREDANVTTEIMENPTEFRRWLYDNGRVLMLE